MKTLKDSKVYIARQLQNIYPETEIQSFTKIILEHAAGLNHIQILSSPELILAGNQTQKIRDMVQELQNHKPIQYITGQWEFLNTTLALSPDALIPRPETEELTSWIIEQTDKTKEYAFLDIGTGSGCIAIALAKNLPRAQTSALDVSKAALKLAAENARRNNTHIDFFLGDILHPETIKIPRKFDIIVSNPPYITESEKIHLDKNVLDHEPDTALFVPDDDPLVFYRAVADFCCQNLKNNGLLYLEINEMYGKNIRQLLAGKEFRDIVIKKDLQGKDRMVKAEICKN